MQRTRPGAARHPLLLVPRAEGPPTCSLSAHGGGGGSSGLRKTCWPRLRNWTTAMRMWCSTRTMLAAARPPAGPVAALGQRVRDSLSGSAPRPGPPTARPPRHQPRLPPRHPGQHLSIRPILGPRPDSATSSHLPPLLGSPPGSQLPTFAPFSCPFVTPFTPSQGSPLRAPLLFYHVLSPHLLESPGAEPEPQGRAQ